MKKRSLMAIFASLTLMTAACGSDEASKDISKPEASETQEDASPANAETGDTKATTESEDAKEAVEKEAAENVADVVNHASNYKENIPYITEDLLVLDKVSYNFIDTNPELFPALTEDAIEKVKKLTDGTITSKHLNKNVTPHLEKIVNFAGDIIQIEEGQLEDGTPYSIILIEDMDFNAIYALGYQSTEFLEGDFVEIWGLPLGGYAYSNVDGGTTLSQVIATSHIE